MMLFYCQEEFFKNNLLNKKQDGLYNTVFSGATLIEK